MKFHQRLIALAIILTVSACSQLPPLPAVPEHWCDRFYADMDRYLAENRIPRLGGEVIDGIPHLRSNRFLASFSARELERSQHSHMIAQLAEQDRRFRNLEIQALPDSVQRSLLRSATNLSSGKVNNMEAALQFCTTELTQREAEGMDRVQAIGKRAEVQDSYSSLMRWMGLYPLVAPFVGMGVDRWHEQAKKQWLRPKQWHTSPQRLIPEPAPTQTSAPARGQFPLPRDALGVPQASPAVLRELAQQHAPVLYIDGTADYDRIGVPVFDRHGVPRVKHDQAVVFYHSSHSRFHGEILLQLNYWIWFDRRPADGMFDPYAGALDGLIYRVSLDTNGNVLLRDSIHPCGCYHRFFPSVALQTNPEHGYREPPLIHKAMNSSSKRQDLWLSSATHYLEGMRDSEASQRKSAQYRLLHYNDMLLTTRHDSSQPVPLFDAQGFIKGTERLEAWYFWPTGVANTGAMRRWGRHATAFVGRRHFDDPRLLENLFQRRED